MSHPREPRPDNPPGKSGGFARPFKILGGALGAAAAVATVVTAIGVNLNPTEAGSPSRAPAPVPAPPATTNVLEPAPATPPGIPAQPPSDRAGERRRWVEEMEGICKAHRLRVTELGSPVPGQESIFNRAVGDLIHVAADEVRDLRTPRRLARDAAVVAALWDEAGDLAQDSATADEQGDLGTAQTLYPQGRRRDQRVIRLLRTLGVHTCA